MTMKPKTKREKLLVELAPKLPPLTEKQMEYPKEHIFKKKGIYWKKGLVWCQCCGKEYPVMKAVLEVSLDIGGEVCEWCGNEIHMEHAGRGTSKYNNELAWYSVITTFKGWQVVRAFEAERSNTRGKDTVYSCREVFQIWIDEKGKETILTKRYLRSPFHLSWDYGSDYGIGHHTGSTCSYYSMEDLFDVTGFYFYPRTCVLPLIRRNGWRSSFVGLRNVNPVELMQALLNNSDIEMLAKTGQHNILQYWVQNGWHVSRDRENDYFDSIKIANRNRYIVQDASMWYDLLDALRYLGLDTHNAHYVCPADLTKAHDTYIRRMQRQKAKEEREQRRKENVKNEAEYKRKKGKFLGICFGNENMTVKVLQSVEAFHEEGEAMHHCVAGYFNKESLVLSARDKENRRIATVELSLRNFKVLQCRAACNKKPERYDEIVSLIESHANDFIRAKKLKKGVVA